MDLKDKLTESRDKITNKVKAGKKDHISGINCEVTNCIYNDQNNQCAASRIKVGPTFASSSSDTVCSTFKPK